MNNRRSRERLVYLAGAAVAVAGATYLVYRHLIAAAPGEAAAAGDPKRDDGEAAASGGQEAGRQQVKDSIISQAKTAKAEAQVRAAGLLAPRLALR